MKRTIIITTTIFFAILFFSFKTYAQRDEPVKWEINQEQLKNNEIMLTFTAKIDKSWHLYSPYNSKGGGLPLTIGLEDELDNKFELIDTIIESRKPIEVYDDIFEKTEIFFDDNVSFKQKIKVKTKSEFILKVIISGQACREDGRCVRIYKEFEIKIN